MEWVDTHAHLFHEDFEKDVAEVLVRAQQVGVQSIYMPSLQADSLAPMYHLANHVQVPRCYACIGLHPCYVDKDVDKQLDYLEKTLAERACVAIGETGLDSYHAAASLSLQEMAFLRHCDWAKQYTLPLILHGRGTTTRLVQLLKDCSPASGGVFHCFSGTYHEAMAAIEMGFFIGIGGILTYKNSTELRDIVQRLPLSALVLETDAPYLTPAGGKTRRNEPAYIPIVGKLLAKCLGCSVEEIAAQTSQNAYTLFGTNQ